MLIPGKGAFQAPSRNVAFPLLIRIWTSGGSILPSVFRPMTKSGVLVDSERRMAQSVVLPRPFSAKTNVNRRNVASPKAAQLWNRPTFLIEIIFCSIYLYLAVLLTEEPASRKSGQSTPRPCWSPAGDAKLEGHLSLFPYLNLGLLMLRLTGVGTPRSFQGRAWTLIDALIDAFSCFWSSVPRYWTAGSSDPAWIDRSARGYQPAFLTPQTGGSATGC